MNDASRRLTLRELPDRITLKGREALDYFRSRGVGRASIA